MSVAAINASKSKFAKKLDKKINKISSQVKLLNEKLKGNYTSRFIDINWDGRPKRYDLINKLIQEYGYKTYLEIGCRSDTTFVSVTVDHRVGVDPASGGTHRMTSDEYFANHNEKFDIIFIDGLHVYEQVIKDIKNAVKVLNDNGTIIMHDCLPNNCLAQYDFKLINQWNGDVWKAFVEARTLPDIDAAVCMIDHGVGVIRKRKNTNMVNLKCDNFKDLKYPQFLDNYKEWTNPVEYSDIMDFIKK